MKTVGGKKKWREEGGKWQERDGEENKVGESSFLVFTPLRLQSPHSLSRSSALHSSELMSHLYRRADLCFLIQPDGARTVLCLARSILLHYSDRGRDIYCSSCSTTSSTLFVCHSHVLSLLLSYPLKLLTEDAALSHHLSSLQDKAQLGTSLLPTGTGEPTNDNWSWCQVWYPVKEYRTVHHPGGGRESPIYHIHSSFH